MQYTSVNNISEDDFKLVKMTQSFFNFFIELIKKRWGLFIIIGLIAGLTGFYYAYKQPVLYEGKLSFALDEGGSGGGSGGIYSLASQFGLSLGNSNDVFGGDNIITILKSRRIIENTLLSVDTFDNEKTPSTLVNYFINKCINSSAEKKKKIDFPPFQSKATFTKEQDSILYKIYLDFQNDYINVWKPDKFLNIFEVKVISENEEFAKLFTNRLVEQASLFYTEMQSKKGLETLNILEQRVATMKSNLNESISEKVAAQDANLNPAFAKAQAPVLRSQANIQTYGAAYGEMFKSLELARYQYLKQIPLFQVIDQAEYPLHKVKTGKVKTALIFSIFACAFTFFIFWLRRITKG